MPSWEWVVRAGGHLGCRFLDLLFPPRCIVCRRPGTWLCEGCLSSLPYIGDPFCQRCGMPLREGRLCVRCRCRPLRVEGIRSVFLFEGPVRVAVHRLKYRGRRSLAEPLGALMADWWAQHPAEIDLVVPVPLHPRRLRQRGYNQAALLAAVLAGRIQQPLAEGVLFRVRYTRPQMELKEVERRRNVRGAFRGRDGTVRGRRILLVDDVCTTGATLEACADALRKAGAAEVWALTLARAP